MSAGGDWTVVESHGGFPGSRHIHSSRGFPHGSSISSDVAGDGIVVYQGTLGGRSALYTFRDNTGSTIVPGSEALPGGVVAMNDAGVVALLEGVLGTFEGEGSRLWLLSDGVTRTVLSEGDPLLGSTVSTIGFDPKGFNNSAQFALLVGLADGRDVFVLASPVPEPTVVGMAMAAMAGVLPRPRRPRPGRRLRRPWQPSH
jgi:hypothetical protein